MRMASADMNCPVLHGLGIFHTPGLRCASLRREQRGTADYRSPVGRVNPKKRLPGSCSMQCFGLSSLILDDNELRRFASCGYSKRSFTAIRHLGTAGSASAMSPLRKITGWLGSLAL